MKLRSDSRSVFGLIFFATAAVWSPALADSNGIIFGHHGMPCESLVGVKSLDAQVTAATMVTPPITLTGPGGTGTVTVPFCRVQGVATPSSQSAINFEVWLPPAAAWTGRLKAEATGGYLGGVAYARMAQEVAEGFVEVGSDLGHEGGQSPTWDLIPQKVDDYGYRAHYYVATAAKAVVGAYYGRPPRYSYFDGCSGGGRQAHIVASRFPNLFDGILAGDPSMFYPDAILELMWLNKTLLPQPSPAPQTVSPAKLALVASAINAECDAKDGLADGQITDPRACKFDPAVLQCKGGDADTCLTSNEISIVREVWRGPHTTSGFNYWTGPYPGSEAFWIANFADSQKFGNFTGDVVYADPEWDYRIDLNFNTDYEKIKNVLTPLAAAPTPDLSAFKAHGGKMIQYHGWTDPVVTGHESPSYYAALSLVAKFGTGQALDEVAENASPEAIANLVANQEGPRDFFRLFMVPNMAHCGGGNGPNAFGESVTYPSPTSDADHDVVRALIRWVENGIAPDKVIATQYTNNNPTMPIVRQRPLCAYPTEARYIGTGDVNQASSFICTAPDRENLVPSAAEMAQIRYSVQSRKIPVPTTN
jgi:feruloyl esterase